MPEFAIRTEEYWLHRVDYVVTAPTLEEAMQMILRGDVSYVSAEIIEGSDEVMQVCAVNDEEVSDEDSERLLREHKARRRWQQQSNPRSL
jgi:hypothetical protein